MVVGELDQAAPGLDAALEEQGLQVLRVQPGPQTQPAAGRLWQVDLSSPEAIEQFHAALETPVGGVINLLPLQAPFAEPGYGAAPARQLAQWSFQLIKHLMDDLRTSARDEGGWLMNVTSLDGQFGCARRGALPVAQASTLGICKTLAREWPQLRVKNVDVDPQLPLAERAGLLAAEWSLDDGRVEVGLDGQRRWALYGRQLQPLSEELGELPCAGDSVVLLTGGACGVTAAAAKELARRAAPQLILVGRSPWPAEEPAALRPYQEPAALRRFLIDQARQQQESTKPAEIEARLRRIVRDREIRANIAAMRAAGARVDYRSVDIRDAEQFTALIDEIYSTYGRLDGVIHGAGIVEDKRVPDKTFESFARVFSTKVDSALTLAARVRSESLKFLVFFSSVSARLGSAGQVDYAAANEYLNKLAAHLDHQWPGRVVAINWGPWRGGMVTDELLRIYKSQGIAVLSLRGGVQTLLDELRLTRPATPEVVIAAGADEVLRRTMNE